MIDSTFRNFTRNLYFDYLEEKKRYDWLSKPKSFSEWFVAYKWFIRTQYRLHQQQVKFSQKWRDYNGDKV